MKLAKEMGLTDPEFQTGKMSNELKQKMNYMKSKHRTNLLLRKWSADGYFFKKDVLAKNDLPQIQDNIERIHVDDLTVEQFIEKYEIGHKPVIITGVTDTWKANTEWQVNVSKLAIKSNLSISETC